MTPPDLAARADAIIQLDEHGVNRHVAESIATLRGEFGISQARAATAIIQAAARQRAALAADPGPTTYTFRLRLTEAQRAALVAAAQTETAGDLSALARRRLFPETAR